MRPPPPPLLLLLALAVLVVAGNGCSSRRGASAPTRPPPAARAAPAARPAPNAPVAPTAAPPSTRPTRTSALVLGSSIEGRPIEAHSLGMGHEVVVVIAGIHGNEPAGTPLAHALIRELRNRPELLANRRVIVVPDANPDGRIANTRSNARGVDLNRNFEAPNRRGDRREGAHAVSEPEAEAIERLVRLHAPHRVLSIHQPLRCVDYDGPSQPLVARMAALSRLPVKKLGTRPGSMGAWLGEGLRIPLITLELPGEASKLDEGALWARYGDAVLAFVTGR